MQTNKMADLGNDSYIPMSVFQAYQVQSFPILWKRDDPDYKKGNLKKVAWEENL